MSCPKWFCSADARGLELSPRGAGEASAKLSALGGLHSPTLRLAVVGVAPHCDIREPEDMMRGRSIWLADRLFADDRLPPTGFVAELSLRSRRL